MSAAHPTRTSETIPAESVSPPRTRSPRRSRRGARTAGIAGLAIVAVAVSGCFALPVPQRADADQASVEQASGPIAPTSVTIPVMLVNSGNGAGSVGTATVSIAQGSQEGMTVEVAESEVSGVGASFRASAWNSVIVATLLTGSHVDADYRFEMHGRVDGPSAGGVSTVALMGLMRGDELADDVAMTGTVTAGGTIGPVGGIPEKVQAIADSGQFTKALIPLGSRMSNDASGRQVDVIRLGRENGLEVVEVGDVTHAYAEFTGVRLDEGGSAPRPKISDEGYSRLEVATRKQINSFIDYEGRFFGLSPEVQDIAWASYEDAAIGITEADRLLNQGLVGGAFVEAVNAQSLMVAITEAYATVDSALVSGDLTVIERRLDNARNVDAKIATYLDELDSFAVKTLPDAEALMTSYGNAFESLTVLNYANAEIDALYAGVANGAYETFEDTLIGALIPLLYLEIADSQLDAAQAIFDIGRGIDGPPIADDVDVEALGTFLRRGSDANLEVFDAIVLSGLAERSGMSMDVARDRLGYLDIGVSLAYTGRDTIHAITAYMGDDNPNAPYAMLGHAWMNYARNAGLVDKYYNNGMVQDFELVGARSEPVLMHTLDFARNQVATAVQALEDHGYSPALIIGSFESNTLDREGDISDKFTAIEGFTGSYAMARILAYLGGFAID